MKTLWLRVRAPFAAFRWMQAGVWRGTSPVIPPSAAWGLVLNLAGIETRAEGSGVATQIRSDAPSLQLAIGEVQRAERAVLYQQIHTYPVGTSGADLAERSFGSKYWIAPARREILVDFDVVLGIRTDDEEVLRRICRGLQGEGADARYGLPFAGDNNFLFDRIDVVESPPAARWYTRVFSGDSPRVGSCRLTVGIDRADSSRTTTALFAPAEKHSSVPPDEAWTWTPRAGEHDAK